MKEKTIPSRQIEILEKRVTDLENEEIEQLASYFLKNRFWMDIFRPALEVQLLERYEQLRFAQLRDIKHIQAAMDVLEMVIEFPEQRLALAQADREMEKRVKIPDTVDITHGVARLGGHDA